MRKTILTSVLAVIMLAGCKKDEPQAPLTECQKENIGYIAFYNNSNDAYDIWIDKDYLKQQPGNSYTKNYYKLPAGRAYSIKVQQVSGYIFTPTVKTYNVTINQCDEKKITFP